MLVNTVLIVDDEENARSRLQRFVEAEKICKNIIYAENGIEAVEKIKTESPDLVFLDIQMPGMTGLEVLNQVQDRKFEVIFQTAYDEFAVKAFEENACDYLLKPFDQARFKASLKKALSRLGDGGVLQKTEESFFQNGRYLENIAVKLGAKAFTIKASDVLCFSGQDDYTKALTVDSEHIIDLTLSHLADKLDPERFFRCHRSHIIDLKAVEHLSLGAQMTIKLNNGFEVPVSRANRSKARALVFSD